MRYPKMVIVTLMLFSMVALYNAAAMMASLYPYGNAGRIKGVNCYVFSDPELTKPVGAQDWESVEPGQLYNMTVYIQSVSNVNTTLYMIVQGWTPPEAQTSLVVSTTPTTPLPMAPYEVKAVVVSLYVQEEAEMMDFSFEIVLELVG